MIIYFSVHFKWIVLRGESLFSELELCESSELCQETDLSFIILKESVSWHTLEDSLSSNSNDFYLAVSVEDSRAVLILACERGTVSLYQVFPLFEGGEGCSNRNPNESRIYWPHVP